MRKKELVKVQNTWWWRNDFEIAKMKSPALKCFIASHLHRRSTLKAVWLYEVHWRLKGEYLSKKPTLQLNKQELLEIAHCWRFNPKERMANFGVLSEPDPHVNPTDNGGHLYWPRLSINLEASNKAIFKALESHLDDMRIKRGISATS
jgi:hypothetical protein